MTCAQLLKMLATFCETRDYITVFKRPRHFFLSRDRWFQFTLSHSVTVRSILILSSSLHLSFISAPIPSDFLTNALCKCLFPHACHIPLPFHSPWFHQPTGSWHVVQITQLIIRCFFFPAVCYFYIPRPKVFLIIQSLSQHSSYKVRDQSTLSHKQQVH